MTYADSGGRCSLVAPLPTSVPRPPAPRRTSVSSGRRVPGQPALRGRRLLDDLDPVAVGVSTDLQLTEPDGGDLRSTAGSATGALRPSSCISRACPCARLDLCRRRMPSSRTAGSRRSTRATLMRWLPSATRRLNSIRPLRRWRAAPTGVMLGCEPGIATYPRSGARMLVQLEALFDVGDRLLVFYLARGRGQRSEAASRCGTPRSHDRATGCSYMSRSTRTEMMRCESWAWRSPNSNRSRCNRCRCQADVRNAAPHLAL